MICGEQSRVLKLAIATAGDVLAAVDTITHFASMNDFDVRGLHVVEDLDAAQHRDRWSEPYRHGGRHVRSEEPFELDVSELLHASASKKIEHDTDSIEPTEVEDALLSRAALGLDARDVGQTHVRGIASLRLDKHSLLQSETHAIAALSSTLAHLHLVTNSSANPLKRGPLSVMLSALPLLHTLHLSYLRDTMSELARLFPLLPLLSSLSLHYAYFGTSSPSGEHTSSGCQERRTFPDED